MNSTSTPNSKYMSGDSVIDSPFIMTREYQKNVANLESENFTLRMLLSSMEKKLTELLKSQNVPNDFQHAFLEMEHKLAEQSAINENKVSNNEIQSLRDQLNSVLKENERLQRELFEHTERSLLDSGAEATIEASSLNAQIEKLKEKISSLESQNQEKQQQIQLLNNINQDLHNKLDHLTNSPQSVESDLNSEVVFDLKRQISSLQTDLTSEVQKGKEKEAIISDLEKQLLDKTNDIDFSSFEETIKTLETATQINDQLKSENKMLHDKNEELVDRNLQMDKTIEELKQNVLELENELASILDTFEVSDIGELLSKYETLKQIRDEQQEQLNEINEENKKLRTEIEDLKSKLIRDDSFNVTSAGKDNTTFSIVDESENSFNTVSPKRSLPMSAQKKIDQLMAENSRLISLNEQLKMYANQIKSDVTLRDSFIQSPSKNKRTNYSVITEQTSPIKPHFALSTAMTEYQYVYESPNKNLISNLKNEILKLTTENEQLREENHHLRQENEDLQNQTEVDLLASDNSIMNRSNQALSREQLLQIITKKDLMIKQLETENENLKNEKDSNLLQIKMELIEYKRKLNQMGSSQSSIITKVKAKAQQFLLKMDKFNTQVYSIITNNLSKTKKIKHSIPKIIKSIGVIPIETIRKDVNQLIDSTSEIIQDYYNCSSVCFKSLPTLTNRDKKVILLLKKRYSNSKNIITDDDEVLPEFEPYSPIKNRIYPKSDRANRKDNIIDKRLNNSIEEMNQTFGLLPPKNYSLLVNQCQLLINAIFGSYGNNRNVPSIIELLKNSTEFTSFIQKTIALINQNQKERSISPFVVNLVNSVKEQVQHFSQTVKQDHNDIINILEKK